MDNLYFENGAIFIFKANGFKKYQNRLFGNIGIFEMNKYKSIDIDDMDDAKIVEKLL